MKNLLVFIIFILLVPVYVLGAPESYIDEYVNADFYMNGTLKSQPERIGYVSVSVNNNHDVLQYIELNLSGNAGTNLQFIPGTNDVRAYRATAASPNIDDKTNMYLNTTENDESLFYTLNSTVAPVINMSISYGNEDGGMDIHTGSNIFGFVINVSSNSNLNNVILRFQSERDVYGPNDAMNVISHYSTSGFTNYINEDGDSFREGVEWNGNLVVGEIVTIYFEGETEPGVNFDSGSTTKLDLAGSCMAEFSQDQTFSGITFENRFSRGPVREGIDLFQETTWSVRGFIKNMAYGIDYEIHDWGIYEVGQSTPLISKSYYPSLSLEPDEILYTDKADTGQSTKKYYSSSFDWNIVWGTSYYSGQSVSTIDMPLLYLIDSSMDKFIIIDKNDENGRTLIVNDTVKHIGDSSLEVKTIVVNSTIPHLSQESHATSWNAYDVEVFYRSGANELDITSLASISYESSTQTQDGYVYVAIASDDLGHTMKYGDEVVVRYKISSTCYKDSLKYDFSSKSILVTESGTPNEESLTETLYLPGTACEGGGGGGGGVTEEEDAWIMAEDSKAYIILGNLADVKVVYRIYDTGTKGLRDMGLMILIPENGELLNEKTDLDLMREGKWEKLTQEKDYVINYNGIVPVGDERYNQYIVDFLLEDTTLYDQDKIKIEYKTELPFGLNEVITEASGYNYYKDKIVSESVHSLIRIDVKLSKFTYAEEEWEQGLVEVGKPVMWLKEIRVKNPNDEYAEESFVNKIFKDSLSVYIVSEDGEKKKLNIMPGEKVNWAVKLKPQEEKMLYLQVYTPPVLEIFKTIVPLFSNETWVSFDMNSTVKNFAKETYKDVTYLFPYSIENIIDYEGVKKLITKGEKTSIVIGDMIPDENVSFYLRYIQKPPILIVTTNGFNFTNTDIMNVKILVIPTEKEERGYVEFETIGPYEATDKAGFEVNPKTTFGDAISVEGKKGSINEFNSAVGLESFIPGKYRLLTYFKKDFATVLTDEKEFYVTGGQLIFEIGYNLLLLILAVFVWFMFTRIERKKDRFKEELRKLKRNVDRGMERKTESDGSDISQTSGEENIESEKEKMD